MSLKVFQAIFIMMIILGFSGRGFAQQENLSPKPAAPEAQAALTAPKEETRERTLEGEIAGVSPNFIAIDYAQDEKTAYEMTFNITKDTRLERIKDIKSLKPGDTVWVSYKEKIVKLGKEVRVNERILKVLRLLNSAKIVVEPLKEIVKEAEEEALEEEESQE